MRTARGGLAVSLGVLVFAALACNFSASTANISDLKLGKDQAAAQQTSSFAPADTIYAVATISNAPGEVKVKGRLVIEERSDVFRRRTLESLNSELAHA